jgi:hypothetical protein
MTDFEYEIYAIVMTENGTVLCALRFAQHMYIYMYVSNEDVYQYVCTNEENYIFMCYIQL